MQYPQKGWLPLWLWMLLIFIVSTGLGSAEHTSLIVEPLLRWLNPHISAAAIEQAHFYIRKTAHFTEYAVLALLALRALKFSRPVDFQNHYWQFAGWALLITAAYAASDEWHQSFVPGRTASPVDVLIDTTGGLAALVAATLWKNFRGQPNKALPLRPPVR